MPTRDAAPRPSRKPSEKSNAPRRKVERTRRVEVERAARDHRRRRQHRAEPEADGERADRLDAPIQQDDVQHADAGGDEKDVARSEVGPDIPRVAGEPDVAGRDFERAAQDELPDEEERHQPAEALAAVGLAEIPVAAARAGHRGAELAPDQAVGDRDEHRHEPPEQGLRPAQRRHQDGDRDEGTDPNHVRHVERGRLQQAEAPGEGDAHRRQRHARTHGSTVAGSRRWLTRTPTCVAVQEPLTAERAEDADIRPVRWRPARLHPSAAHPHVSACSASSAVGAFGQPRRRDVCCRRPRALTRVRRGIRPAAWPQPDRHHWRPPSGLGVLGVLGGKGFSDSPSVTVSAADHQRQVPLVVAQVVRDSTDADPSKRAR